MREASVPSLGEISTWDSGSPSIVAVRKYEKYALSPVDEPYMGRPSAHFGQSDIECDRIPEPYLQILDSKRETFVHPDSKCVWAKCKIADLKFGSD